MTVDPEVINIGLWPRIERHASRLDDEWAKWQADRAGVDKVLARAGMFHGVEPSAVSALTKQLQPVDFRSGHTLFAEGEPGDRLFIVTGAASHGSLGAQLTDEANASGARIVKVSSGGPAAAAGVPAGAVVTRVDGRSISNAEELTAAVHSKAPGATIALDYFDPTGDARTAHVVLGTDHGQQS
jgi:S1-C subfamily serine protease